MNELDNLSDQMFQPLSDEEQAALTGAGSSVQYSVTWNFCYVIVPDPDTDYEVDINNSN